MRARANPRTSRTRPSTSLQAMPSRYHPAVHVAMDLGRLKNKDWTTGATCDRPHRGSSAPRRFWHCRWLPSRGGLAHQRENHAGSKASSPRPGISHKHRSTMLVWYAWAQGAAVFSRLSFLDLGRLTNKDWTTGATCDQPHRGSSAPRRFWHCRWLQAIRSMWPAPSRGGLAHQRANHTGSKPANLSSRPTSPLNTTLFQSCEAKKRLTSTRKRTLKPCNSEPWVSWVRCLLERLLSQTSGGVLC